ncbi:type 1 fimbrial protein [Leclercia adecarboxylata]|uniref:type 1 fimbrial protein n=1 Tax=Leclercia adecarboxylata TaxID=83655 RepID=UPI002DBB90AF|nr:type 1 fimbrial protein [Leclercia adecarboxylata]MEB6378954.1 type 1 fimbrial protein [Leclercia adecarboxylata]
MVSSRITLAAACIAAVTLTPAYAGHVIHISGQIVEDPCNITPDAYRLSVTCPQNNKMSTQLVSYKDALNGNVPAADRATISMNYINPEKSLAVVQVDYR